MGITLDIDSIDIDAFEEAIEFDPIETRDGNDRGYCPLPWGLHQNGDTTGKFAIHREKKVWHCWVCGGGGLIELVRGLYDFDHDQAVEFLLPLTKSDAKSDGKWKDQIKEKFAAFQAENDSHQELPYFNPSVLDRLDTDHPWFDERGISKAVRSAFYLGYNPSAIHQDHEGGAIVLTHFWQGQLVGWQYRWLGERPSGIPKYTNTRRFPKRTTLWGYDFASKIYKRPVIVESVPTALFVLSEGYPAIATFGASVTDEQAHLLRVFQRGVILAPDNDKAGEEWTQTLTKELKRFIPIDVMPPLEDLGVGADLGDLVDDRHRLHKGIDGIS